MKLSIRHCLSSMVLGLCAGVSAMASAQTYPQHPIRLIVPFTAGGAVDQTARTVSMALGEKLGQPIVIENRPGAGGAIGAAETARAKPDGYTLMLALDTTAANYQIMKDLRYDTFKSFDYLNLLVTTPQILVARGDLPVNSLEELIAYIKAHPGTTYGTSGLASAGHVNSAQMALARDLKTTHVPYKGAAPMITDLLGGHIDFAFAGVSVLYPHIQAGKVRALAVGSSQRSAMLPDVPMMSESIPGLEYPTWVGLVAPAGLAEPIRAKILAAMSEVMQDPLVAKRFAENGFDVMNSSPEAFKARLEKDAATLEELIRLKVVTTDPA
ncbi:Bug family tripartite tricarboxylate transporter substrate binding protein [Bordetella avium]|uniref:Bug family tripartite tricarboxylate transporter substrate binding protein n=1 Tax=Bordetella avium TaxID=521 RepID=UPI001F4D6833|nr:tripartite tricarboxylate transporter substrate binding protein [Bordetella avium]